MSDIITTLHPDNDEDTNLYPNIKKENIPNASIDESKLDNSVINMLSNAIASIHQPKYVTTLPTTDQGLVVYSDGYLYYWNGSQYVTTGILYQASQSVIDGANILEKTIIPNRLNNFKHYKYSNYINLDIVNKNTYVNGSGVVSSTTGFSTTNKVYLEPETTYYEFRLYLGYCAFYDENDNVLASYDGSHSPFTLYNAPRSIYQFTTPANTSYAIFTIASTTDSILEQMWIYHEGIKPLMMKYKYYFDVYTQSANSGIYVKPTDYEGKEIEVFRKCLCIGDSFTQGGFNADSNPESQTEFQDYSYPTKLKQMTNIDTTNLGYGGLTTPGWALNHINEITGGFDFCIILLGINDCVYYGEFGEASQTALGQIIDKVKLENANIKIFVSTIPLSPAYKTTAIVNSREQIINYIESRNDENLYIVDLATYGHLDDSVAYTYGHPTALGYYRLALDYRNYISYIINENKEDFRWVQFIGTDKTHNTPI